MYTHDYIQIPLYFIFSIRHLRSYPLHMVAAMVLFGWASRSKVEAHTSAVAVNDGGRPNHGF